ncbi:MAG: epoxyqueuosine reductase, partial [Planctomycetes bacterium]|nr:epoxyqueuosine reductase [Planctomycetota bacterium]
MDIEYIRQRAIEFISQSGLNKADEIGLGEIYDDPIFAVSSADDSLYEELKKDSVIGPHHMSPSEWLTGARSAVCYFLPFSAEVRKANACEGLPALEWVYGRIEGEHLNNELRAFLAGLLREEGGEALAPVLDERFKVIELRSNWSERHVAFISGLGTFGLSKSMITRKGSAGRFGSAVTTLELEPAPREYTDIYEWCSN